MGLDGDGILDDGDDSGAIDDNPCTGGTTQGCDDNCRFEPNPLQEDTDGEGTGDACECGDANRDGFVNLTDSDLIQQCVVGIITDPEICTPPPNGPSLCDVTLDPLCNTTDARLIQRFDSGELTKDDLRCVQKNGPGSGGAGGSSALTADSSWSEEVSSALVVASATPVRITVGQRATLSVGLEVEGGGVSALAGSVDVLGLGTVAKLAGPVELGPT